MTSAANRTRRRPWSNQRGASLIETLVALGLFGMTAATMSGFLTHQIRRGSSNHLNTVAYGLAEDALESARAMLIGDLVGTAETFTEGGTTFTVSSQVEDNTPASGLKTVTATVTWTDHLGQQEVSVPAVYTEVRRF